MDTTKANENNKYKENVDKISSAYIIAAYSLQSTRLNVLCFI